VVCRFDRAVPQGLKPSYALFLAARLKSCPDTKPKPGDFERTGFILG
jgi:hypothetical protein